MSGSTQSFTFPRSIVSPHLIQQSDIKYCHFANIFSNLWHLKLRRAHRLCRGGNIEPENQRLRRVKLQMKRERLEFSEEKNGVTKVIIITAADNDCRLILNDNRLQRVSLARLPNQSGLEDEYFLFNCWK